MGKNLHAEECPDCGELLYYDAKCCDDIVDSLTIYRVVNVDGAIVTTIIPPTYEERVINQLKITGREDIVYLTKELQDYCYLLGLTSGESE